MKAPLWRRALDRVQGLPAYDQVVFRSRILFESDEACVQRKFREVHGAAANLEHPRTFCEKVVWLMLHYRPPRLPALADKFDVRAFIRSRLGDNVLAECLGLYERVEEIPWDRLPEKFVLKATHGSKWNVICTDKAFMQREKEEEKLRRWLTLNFYWFGREWVYRDLPPRIIAEAFLDDGSGAPPPDYKIYCFGGEPRLVQVDQDRFRKHRRSFYTPAWELLPIGMLYPRIEEPVPAPLVLDEMLQVARTLSSDFAFVRVDVYALPHRVVVGELTFYPERGLGAFDDDQINCEVGSWIELPDPIPDRGLWSRLPAVFH